MQNESYMGSDEFDKSMESFRFMEPDVVEKLLENFRRNDGVKELSVMFVNLYGANRLTEQMEVETCVQMYNEYFELMVDAIFAYKGTLDKYIGSTIVAVFGAYCPLEDHALMATKAALAMRERLPKFNSSWFPEEQHPLRMGIGINTDRLFSGYVGSPQRMELTVVGHGVNVANHLSQQTKQYGCDILIGQKTYESCAEYVQVRERNSTQLKPEGKPFKVYELIGLNA